MEAEFRVIDSYGGNHAKTQMVTCKFARRRGPDLRLCHPYDFGRGRRACKHNALAAELVAAGRSVLPVNRSNVRFGSEADMDRVASNLSFGSKKTFARRGHAHKLVALTLNLD